MSSLNTRFDAADNLAVLEINDYRSFFFPPSVCKPNGEVYFSLDNAPEWMTACGYRLWQEHDPTKRLGHSFQPDNALLKELRGYRDQIIGPAYLKHPFFGVDRAKKWMRVWPSWTIFPQIQMVPAEHPAEPLFHWSTGFVLDPALEPNYHVLGGSDDPVASSAPNYSASGSDYVLLLPPSPPPLADQPTETSGPSRARRRKREPEVDPANEVEGKRSRTASRRARGEEILQDKIR
ncbi:hypothetical protein B0H19DRAFT_1061630 [Mycena capillaripes]|nr:hypothetical protein B0H19DRAFT_1061630 [Mycena capillaripes]